MACPRFLTAAVLVLALVGVGVPFADATTYYVRTDGHDTASGLNNTANASTGAWLTPAKAIATAVAGDTVLYQNGTYVTSLLDITNSGTSSNRITHMAQNRGLAIFSDTSVCTGPAIAIHASFITIDGIRIQANASKPNNCTYSSANAAIRGWNTNEPTLSGNQSTGYTDSIIRYVTVDPSPGGLSGLPKFHTGIKMNQDRAIVENCTVNNEIEMFNGVDQIVRYNAIFDGSPNTSFIVMKGGARNGQVYGNIVTSRAGSNWGSGILLGGGGYGYWDDNPGGAFGPPRVNGYITCYNCIAYNNVFVNQNSVSTNAGIGMWACQDCIIFNNVVIAAQLFLAWDCDGGLVSAPNCTPNVNPNFYNNIVVAAGQNVTPTNAVGGSNGWDNVSGFTAYLGSRLLSNNTFFGFTGTIPTQSSGALTSNPLFINSLSDWHLQTPASPALNSGVTVTPARYGGGFHTVNLDIDSVPRPIGAAWDRGIYEMGAPNKRWYKETGSLGSTCGDITTTIGSTVAPTLRLSWSATWACMQGGDTFHMQAGIYAQRIPTNAPAGSVGAPTIIEGEGAAGCGKAENCNTTLTLDNTNVGFGLNFTGNMTLRNFEVDGTGSGSTAACLAFSTTGVAANILIDNMELHHCGGHGVFTQSDVNNLTIQFSSIHDTNQSGVDIGGHGCYLEGDNTVLDNNVFHDITSGTNIIGCQLFDSTSGKSGTVANSVVKNNEFRNITQGDALVVAGPNILVYNNIFHHSLRGVQHYGGSTSNPNGCNTNNRFYNNIIHHTQIAFQVGSFSGTGCTGGTVDFGSNLVLTNNGNDWLNNSWGWTSNGTKNAGTCGTPCGTAAVNVSDIKTVTLVTDETNPLSDYHLKSGTNALVNTGTCFPTLFTTDKDGLARPTSGCDIGPYERAGGGDTTPPAPPSGLQLR